MKYISTEKTMMYGVFCGAALSATVLIGTPLALATSAWLVSKPLHYLYPKKPDNTYNKVVAKVHFDAR